MIYTSRSAYTTTDECWRRRWLGYEATNGTATHGWQRRAHALPLATGTYVHQGLAGIVQGHEPYEAATAAGIAYAADMNERGLDTAGDMTAVIAEQQTLITGLVFAWGIRRWPQVRQEWDVESVEQEGQTEIAPDITQQFRCDWIGRRKADGARFIWNFKTLSMLDERWLKGHEIDPQHLLDAWCVEHAQAGDPVQGVIIEGLIKGTRRKDKDEFGQVTGERQQSILCYGYHHAGNPPLTPPEWTHEYRRARGWQRFAVGAPGHPNATEWVYSLPSELLDGLFVTVPPIYRDDERVLSKLTQVTYRERDIAQRAEACREDAGLVDAMFPQNERSCLWPSRCPFFDACHTPGVAGDMAGSGLYMPRVPNHPAATESD